MGGRPQRCGRAAGRNAAGRGKRYAAQWLRCLRSLALGGPVRLRLGLHLGKAGEVVREPGEMGPRDLRRHDEVIVGDIGLRIARATLELPRPSPSGTARDQNGAEPQSTPIRSPAAGASSRVKRERAVVPLLQRPRRCPRLARPGGQRFAGPAANLRPTAAASAGCTDARLTRGPRGYPAPGRVLPADGGRPPGCHPRRHL